MEDSKVKIPAIIAISFAIIGCAGTPPVQRLQDSSLFEVRGHAMNMEAFLKNGKSEEDGINIALQNLTDSLKDPDSAKFRNVRMKAFDGMHVVCGEVNAKNSYGGYTGFKKFAAGPKESSIESSEISRHQSFNAASNYGINSICGN